MTPRRLALFAERLPFVVSASAALTDWRSKRWLKRHPGRTFADYYVAWNEERTSSSRPHPTLGTAGYRGGDKQAIQWTADSFRERGHDIWLIYREHGLTPRMRTVDYGCGSLRIGQHAIDFLDAGRYCGIDPSTHFIEAGLSMLDPDLIASKRPWLPRLDAGAVEQVGAWKPEFIFSHAVLQHVPRAELPTYFQRLGAMMGSGCRAVIMFACATRERRTKAMSWAYPQGLLEAVARTDIPDARFRFAGLPPGKENISGGGRRLMIIER